MAGIPNVRLRLSNRAENVLLVRQALSGVGEVIALDPLTLNDISTAVTEACNNVVVHAYGGAEGPLEVELTVASETIEVIVRDHGIGIHPGLRPVEETSGGIGLPVIQALSESVEFRGLPAGGTEVAISFSASGAEPLVAPSHEDATALEAVEGEAGDVTQMSVAPTAIARAVVPRVLSTLAARAFFSTDGISDTQLLADALVAQTDGSVSASHLNIGVSVAPRNLEVRIGPLHSGSADVLLGDSALGGLGSVLERLTDGHSVSASGAAEVLDLRLAQRS